MALSKSQKATANLVYNQAIKAGLKPKRAREFVAAAYAESGLNPRATNKSSGAAGLFQLLSSGYVQRANKMGGVYNPVANIKSILPNYKQYWATHPNAAPGEGARVTEASGMGASFYSRPLSLLGPLGGAEPSSQRPGPASPGLPSRPGTPARTVLGAPVNIPGISFDPGLAKSYNSSMKALGLSGLNFNSLSLPALTYRPSTTVPGTPGRPATPGGGKPRRLPASPEFRTGLGKVVVAPGADRAGVHTNPLIKNFVAQVAGTAGMPITITTGTNHNQYVLGTHRQSDHWQGNAADIAVPVDSAKGDKIAAAALVRAGVAPKKAMQMAKAGGVWNFNVNGHRLQVLWKTMEGGNHHNHVHIGLR